MKSSIYISTEKIEVLGYSKAGRSVAIKEFVTRPLPEGTMINGKITDSAVLVECLSALRAEKPALFKEPMLTVDGSSILSKRITAPKLNRKQYAKLVSDEFSDSAEALDTLVCDYHQLDGGTILACATEKTQVESYISAFKDAGIGLKAIRVGMQAILSYVGGRPDLGKMTFVLNVVDGLSMLSMIFDKGTNVFMSRTRLYSENRDELRQDILSNLSGLIQFNKSENFDDIAFSCYLGLTAEDVQVMRGINPYHDIRLDVLDIKAGDKLSADAHFVYLNTLLGDDSIDFIRSYKALSKLEKKRRPIGLWIPALAAIIAALVLPVVFLYVATIGVDASIASLNEYLRGEEVAAKSAEIDAIIEETAYYSRVGGLLNDKRDAETEKTAISGEILDLITQTSADSVNVNQFDFNENTEAINVSGSSATETDSAAYVEALKLSPLIKAVYYTGYSYGGDGRYNFSIGITLEKAE